MLQDYDFRDSSTVTYHSSPRPAHQQEMILLTDVVQGIVAASTEDGGSDGTRVRDWEVLNRIENLRRFLAGVAYPGGMLTVVGGFAEMSGPEMATSDVFRRARLGWLSTEIPDAGIPGAYALHAKVIIPWLEASGIMLECQKDPTNGVSKPTPLALVVAELNQCIPSDKRKPKQIEQAIFSNLSVIKAHGWRPVPHVIDALKMMLRTSPPLERKKRGSRKQSDLKDR